MRGRHRPQAAGPAGLSRLHRRAHRVAVRLQAAGAGTGAREGVRLVPQVLALEGRAARREGVFNRLRQDDQGAQVQVEDEVLIIACFCESIYNLGGELFKIDYLKQT